MRCAGWVGLPKPAGAVSAAETTLLGLVGGGLFDGLAQEAIAPRLRSEKIALATTVVDEELLSCTTTEVARSARLGQESIAFLGAQQSTELVSVRFHAGRSTFAIPRCHCAFRLCWFFRRCRR
jgi:hypothetical protein